MNVLSLFDGISCGQIALSKLGVKVDNYFASEIEKTSIKVTQTNFPNTIQLGDVCAVNADNLPKIDLLIGGSPCFVAGTKVITKNAIKNIEDVVVGDYVLTHTNTFQKVLKVGCKHSNTLELKAQGMKPTKTTYEHPYYVRSMTRVWNNDTRSYYRSFSNPYWKNAGDLTKGDFIGIPRLNTSENIYNLTHEECWIIGRYIADGHTRKDYRNTENRSDDRYWQVILSVANHKLDALKSAVKELNYSAYPHSKSVTRVVFSNKRLVEIVETECGCGAENKHISMNLLNLPVDLLKSLLDGYLSGDGHIKNGVCKVSSISELLILNLHLAILKVYGVNSNYVYTKRKKTTVIEGRLVNQSDAFTTEFRFDMKLQSNAKLIDDIMWLPIRCSSINESTIVYNLEVENDNSYTANNIIVHNCQSFSSAVSSNTGFDGKSKLFFEFLRLLKETNPTYWLLENVEMKKEWEDVITNHLGVNPVHINSDKFSAQSRPRVYWTNIPLSDTLPSCDLLLKDVLESNVADKYFYKESFDYVNQNVVEAILNIKGHDILKRVNSKNAKCQCLTAVCGGNQQKKVIDGDKVRKLTPLEYERLQNIPDNYTSMVSDSARYQTIGNGWEVNTIVWLLKGIQ